MRLLFIWRLQICWRKKGYDEDRSKPTFHSWKEFKERDLDAWNITSTNDIPLDLTENPSLFTKEIIPQIFILLYIKEFVRDVE